MTERSCLAIILAAGEGTRMRSQTPKVLHEIARRPMIGHVLKAAEAADVARRAVVVGHGAETVAKAVTAFDPAAAVFEQTERLGTAHAVRAASPAVTDDLDDVVILYGDVPLVTSDTVARLRAGLAAGADLVVLGFEAQDPSGYGRLVMEDRALVAIREEREASDAERAITLCNSGMLAVRAGRLLPLLEAIGNDNAKGEYYLTDAIAIARQEGLVVSVEITAEAELMGVNDRAQLAAAEAAFQASARQRLLASGVTLQVPDTVIISADTVIEPDAVIEPHVVFGPGVKVGTGAAIHAFSHLEGAVVEAGASIGPYARLRPGSVVREKGKIGNFVETKNTEVGVGAKINHLSYVGDASVGAGANIGAGTITCNYDGVSKFRTVIGEGAFIGSNSALVAPVTIGDTAYVGTGSVITDDVPAASLAIARGRQVVKPDRSPIAARGEKPKPA
ncbi:bifunctional UDP-N-acetylglucosamine diphosphorylase/glucosamine-1-phosphate N-acetyltransferase GlmU [Amorphus coralli]|uniref:bifunctional UDP-N-acetylglucosamine diphosphorylase/glucosamine-1-phosphate N-acetyltransferase GlmU n=1 Tax=Amorphus coralli TaxID=340680 RepID=UPI0003608C96|nr:bifunctional UDP-N-acetylglucosamine diphosphorylase/glucosamine-1-phosphate N-acetyltransferase GlmU [Amorphus coralli]